MKELFLVFLRVGFSGSIMILPVLLLRCFLKKAPAKIMCVLWLLVIVRLLLPIQLESQLSLQPRYDFENRESQAVVHEADPSPKPEWTPSGEYAPDDAVIPEKTPIAIPEQTDYLQILSVIWVSVAAVLAVYTVAAYGVLRFRVRDAVTCGKNVMESDRIRGAFALGYIRPRIYLPVGLGERERALIIAHERSHVARGDNWLKLAGFLACCVHWYNPLIWISYVLLCRDIELACDERVVGGMGLEERKMYSLALLNCGKRLSGYMVCPVAFGEVNLKQRIKNVLSYRHPAPWISIAAVVMVGIVAVCFLTNPIKDETPPTEPEETVAVHIYDDGVMTVAPECGQNGEMTYTCTKCGETKIEPVPALSHVFGEGVQTEIPTCSASGVIAYTCRLCGVVKTEEIDTLAHTFGEPTVSREPTCKEEGEMSAECSVCGCVQVVDSIPKTEEHQFENQVIRKPTCVDHGEGADVCTVCGYSVSCDYKLADHAYGDAVVTVPAGCTKEGKNSYTCKVCGAVYTKSVKATGHTWDDGPCDARGTCTVCGTVSLLNRGHDYALTREIKPTQGEFGIKDMNCTRCGTGKRYLYGKHGSYDLSAAKTIALQHARDLGLSDFPKEGFYDSSYQHLSTRTYFRDLELAGGQDGLEQKLISLVDKLYGRYVAVNPDPGKYCIKVSVNANLYNEIDCVEILVSLYILPDEFRNS